MIVVDAGNTRVKLAWMDISRPGELPSAREFAAIPVGLPLPQETLQSWLDEASHSDSPMAVIAGSNPAEVDRVLREWPSTLPRLHPLGDRYQLPLFIDVEHPEKVGIDRLLNAIAANACRDRFQCAIIVDSGTATTIDLVDNTGAFRGGAILPGFEMGARALHQYTALLPLIQHHRLHDRPPSVIGRNTTEALESGLYWGHVGAVRQLIEAIQRQAEPNHATRPLVLLTGGASPMLRRHFPDARWEAGLCLQGLALAASSLSRGGSR